MKSHLCHLITESVTQLQQTGILPTQVDLSIQIERPRDKGHGDFSCNIAMVLAKAARCKPRELAQKILATLPQSDQIEKVEVAGPGFINFFMSVAAFYPTVPMVLENGTTYGRSNVGEGKRVHIEFVSANPTGPLHVGHGRGAAYGAVVANLLSAGGFDVHREYYVNDAGRQMNILAISVWLRYLELCGEPVVFPSNGYQGEYVKEIALNLRHGHGEEFRLPWENIIKALPPDEPSGDREIHIDALIQRCQQLLGEDNYDKVHNIGLTSIVNDIRNDLEEFRVVYDEWYSERSLIDNRAVSRVIERLKSGDHIYEKNGALWCRSTDFGDEKDRVVVRDNGQYTYFASDIAYHMEKFERGFDQLIDIWGADHHGYVPRVKAAMQALGYDAAKLDVLLVQFAVLYRGGKKVQMSTRSGEFVTLRQLREEVGTDAGRFFYVMRKCEQHLDFDLDLAKSKTSENPVFYIQYAHARICNVMHKLNEKGMTYDQSVGINNLELLKENHEQTLLATLSRYPEVVEAAALNQEPHLLAYYLRDLANDLHVYYDTDNKRIVILNDHDGLRNARLTLILAVRQVIANGLDLLGVSAPDRM